MAQRRRPLSIRKFFEELKKDYPSVTKMSLKAERLAHELTLDFAKKLVKRAIEIAAAKKTKTVLDRHIKEAYADVLTGK